MLYQLNDVRKTRAGKRSFELVIRNLAIAEGARIAITGPSGCGKSTTLDILGMSLSPDPGGEFLFQPPGSGNAVQISRLWEQQDTGELAELRLRYLGYVLQTGELFPYLTVGENLQFVAKLAGQDKRDTEELARQMAARLDIGDNWDSWPGTLSVGERQRVAIGRAIVGRPKVILADEPTAALDPLHAEDVMQIFLEALEDFGSALVLVTHNTQWALSAGLAEAAFVLEKKADGATVSILDFPGGEGAS